MLAWLMLVSPGAVSAEDSFPPDQIDPPAEGEGQPLQDPSEPESSGYSTAAAGQPSPSISLSGRSWRNPRVESRSARNAFASAVKASRAGWSNTSRFAVVASGTYPGATLAASSLAGAVNGPLLLSRHSRLSDVTRRELNRLSPQRVFVVGSLPLKVSRAVARTGTNVTRIDAGDSYQTAMAVARAAIQRGANRGTVIVASGTNWKESLAVPALAAGKQWPVLLAKRSSGRAELARRVRDLGASRVLVAARRSVINSSVVSGLPNVTRIAGSGSLGTGAAIARRGQAGGLDNRPVVAGAGHWVDAVVWGAMAGNRRNAMVVPNAGSDLATPALRFLDSTSPRRVTVVRGATDVGKIARCQIGRGSQRSWYCAEKTLRRQGYHMPRVDGRADRFSIWAIYAFEKVAGLGARGSFANQEWDAMVRNPRMKVRRPDLPDTHVEINIGKQLILLIKNGKARNVIHTSTGKSSTPTIRGTFTVYEKRPYYQPHNRMYYPIFFQGGYAFHGYPEIPTYPASAGCARTYNGNMDFIYPKIFIGERVATY